MSSQTLESLHCGQVGRYADLKDKPNPDGLVLVFTPSLTDLLKEASRRQDGLSAEEIRRIADEATVEAMTPEDAQAVRDMRGYHDVDPDWTVSDGDPRWIGNSD
jgi:hypothetical protein